MKLLKALLTVVILWALSILTVYILKGWGPIEALVRYTGQGSYLAAGGLLAAVVIMLLVLLYVFGKILDKIPAAAAKQLAQNLSQIGHVFFGP